MSHATLAASFVTAPIPQAQIQRLAKIGTETLSAAVQTATFAALLWLILAGPGFLQDLASTVPLR